MGSSLTIINQEQQKKLYKNLEGKWVIELDSEKIKNINDFCIAIMDEIDIIYDYKHLYGYDWYSFRDAAMESEHIVKKLFGDKEANVVIIYDNSKLIMSEIDRGISYQYLIALTSVVSELLTQAIQILTKNPHFNSSLGILKNKQDSNKTAGGFLNVGMSVGLKNPLLPEKISIDLEKIIKKEIENAIKSQLKLSKITDSKKVNLKIQKAIKVPDKIAKFLNLLPNPSNWWRAITK